MVRPRNINLKLYINSEILAKRAQMHMRRSIATLLAITGDETRGTANSLRMMGNRMGQFVIPFLAGLIAAASGVAGIFLIIGASLGISGAVAQLQRRAQ